MQKKKPQQKQNQKPPHNNNKNPRVMIWDESWLVAQKIKPGTILSVLLKAH